VRAPFAPQKRKPPPVGGFRFCTRLSSLCPARPPKSRRDVGGSACLRKRASAGKPQSTRRSLLLKTKVGLRTSCFRLRCASANRPSGQARYHKKKSPSRGFFVLRNTSVVPISLPRRVARGSCNQKRVGPTAASLISWPLGSPTSPSRRPG